MPWLACKSRRIHYELTGPEDGPACVLVNGLSQYVKVWMPFRDGLVARGFCVARYDMLGQGQSDKPRLFIEQSDQVEVLRDLIASLGPRPVFIGGISFGGVIALRYAIEHPGTIAGLVPMSSFRRNAAATRCGSARPCTPPSFSAARPTCRTCCSR